jgi:hypothetical protein
VSNSRATPFIKRSPLIFLPLCSNPNAVLAIPAGAEATSPLTQWLGGQHGEEEKVEDEVSGKEGRKEDKAPEEEVGSRHFTVFGFALMSMTASHGPAAVELR